MTCRCSRRSRCTAISTCRGRQGAVLAALAMDRYHAGTGGRGASPIDHDLNRRRGISVGHGTGSFIEGPVLLTPGPNRVYNVMTRRQLTGQPLGCRCAVVYVYALCGCRTQDGGAFLEGCTLLGGHGRLHDAFDAIGPDHCRQ